MGIKRTVDTAFWSDNKVVDLFSPEDKLFMLYLLTNPHTTQLGIYPISKKVMAFEIGYSLEAVSVLLERFENRYNIIRYSIDTSEVAIKNYLRHSIIKGGKPVEDLLVKEISKVKDKGLLKYVCGGLALHDDLNDTVKKVMALITANDNDNDNDNDCIVSTNRTTNRTTNRQSTLKKEIPPTLDEVRAYISEKQYIINAQDWYDYYESNDWKTKDGKKMIKNWKQYVVSWNSREKKSQGQKPQNAIPDREIKPIQVEVPEMDEERKQRLKEIYGEV